MNPEHSEYNQPACHLLCSVLLTDTPLYSEGIYGNRVSPSQLKIDQFLSMIHSYSHLPLVSQDFYIALSNEYELFRDLVDSRILELFPEARIVHDRLERFPQWTAAISMVDTSIDYVLLASNHDHVYLHETPEPFKDYLRFLKQSELQIGHLSHWQECLAVRGVRFAPIFGIPGFTYPTNFFIGTAVVDRDFLADCFKTDFTEGAKFVRPDNPFGGSLAFSSRNCGVPIVELVRHLDGYGHARIHSALSRPMRSCCKVDVNSQTVSHSSWIRGSGWEIMRGKADLPRTAIGSDRDHLGEILSTVKTAVSYRARSQVIVGLTSALTKGAGQSLRVGLGLLVSTRFWISALAPLFFPIRLIFRPWPRPKAK